MAFRPTTSQDKVIKAYRLSIEISGAGDQTQKDNQWSEVINPPGTTLDLTPGDTGQDAYAMSLAGQREHKEVTLSGAVTPTRGAIFKWFEDTLFKGGEPDVYKDVTINYYGAQGTTPTRSTAMERCFITGYSIGPLTASSQEPLLERITFFPNIYRDPMA